MDIKDVVYMEMEPMLRRESRSGTWRVNDKYRINGYLEDSNGEDDIWIHLSVDKTDPYKSVLFETDTENAESEEGLKKAISDCVNWVMDQTESGHKADAIVDDLFAGKFKAATKDQERKALGQIRKIIESLGPDSYVGAAFEGCFDIAESNIENDLLYGTGICLAELQECRKELEQKEEELMAEREETDKLHDHIRYLKKQLDKELEWKDYTSPYHVNKEEYLELAMAGCSPIYEERAKAIVSERFGFQIDMIHIIQEMPVEQINRHKQVKVVGSFDCRPIYFARDLNYIRFECMGTIYEVYNGDLMINR